MDDAHKAKIWIAAIPAVVIAASGVAIAIINHPNDGKPGAGDKSSTPVQTSPTPSLTPTSAPTPKPTATTPKPAAVTISLDSVKPRGGHKGISVADGIQARGRVQNLPAGHTLWLMDRDVKGYTIDQPAKKSGEAWTAESYPLGDADTTVPFEMTVVVVWASPRCTGELRGRVDTPRDQMTTLPAGCVERGEHDIKVTEK